MSNGCGCSKGKFKEDYIMELTRTTITKDEVLFGEQELTNLCWTLIRIFRFKSGNRDPKTIIFPDIKEVGGVKIEFPNRAEPSEVGSPGS